MDNGLKLRVMFDMIDNWTKPLRNVLNSNKGLAQSLKQTRGELAELGKQQKAVASFREMRSGLAETTTKLTAAQANVKALAGSLRAFGPPSQKMIADLARARQAASQLRAEQKKQTESVEEMRRRLAQAGVDTRNLAQHERTLRSNIAATTAAIHAQTRQLEAQSEREKKLATARGKMQAMQGVAGGMAVGGYAARSTGMRVLGGLGGTLDEEKKMTSERSRITALGLGDQATKDAEKYVRAMDTMGVSTTDNMTLMRDALSIFADEHHAQMVMPTLAKMKLTNDALFGAEDAHANEEKFMNMLKVIELRGGMKDDATFKNEANMVQKVLSATGGRVGGDEWRNFIQTGGVAAKQMRQDAFYYQMEPLIQEMGGHAVGTGLMSAYSNVYQGKTTVRAAKEMMNLGLLDKKNVEYNKIGMIKRVKPGALMGGDLFKASPLEWLEKVLLPQMAKKGITDPDKVKDMISTIFTNRTAANLFSTMYMQRVQIHKNERLNKGAYGIDDGAKLAAQMTQGKENDALAKAANLKREIGERITPVYNAALDKTREILGGLIGLIQRHSAAAKVILVVLVALAALLVVMGTFTIALAGVLGPLAIVKFSMSTLAIEGGILSRVLGAGAAAWRMFAGAAMFAGRAMLMTPIGLAITAVVAVIAGAAYLIYRYWKPISGFFARLWDSVKKIVSSAADGIMQFLMNWTVVGFIVDHWNDLKAITLAIWALIKAGVVSAAQLVVNYFMNWTLFGVIVRHWDEIKAAAGAAWKWIADMAISAGRGIADFFMNWTLLGLIIRNWDGIISFLSGMVSRFTTIGGQIIDGLIAGFTGGMNALKSALHDVGENAISWFKEKLGIHSPSRVFAELGGFMSEGAALGIEGEQRSVARAALGLATAAMTGFGSPALATAAPIIAATVPIDNRPPIAAAGPSAAVASAAAPSPIVINIYSQAGDDPRAIARAVAAELDRRERAQRGRTGSRLTD
ncbi:phage tail tape measure protein [Burkholderia ubonensis]|uniref:phage tail tape measure protein n=1 Tax=Burkholderia ubonensis TaxID=101571 RepID=UPI000753394F|nr:hypothetical protein [Burkholderia ubonensis]KVS40954.1 hypothetical protein WK37_20575 [Burkholderia ubonensis]KVS53114.1 hypothetical protein WK38_09490 [Burkholderia ubonensis]KVS71308.1 hypothetical protein WK42_24940 [Burkholderia ubonensis]KVS83382.1 hypothetical protein WK43_24935 [Burkholderia ubonensis]KVS88514.1 hypothetical protein WK45_27500 [Burkholderia ubonensis]